MKRFKLIFHIIYILITLALMYFSVDILMNTEAYLSKIKLSSYIKFPRYVMGLFLFISIIMAVEYAMQQIRINNIKKGIDDLKSEIVELKAKLYDQGAEQDTNIEEETSVEENAEAEEETEGEKD